MPLGWQRWLGGDILSSWLHEIEVCAVSKA